MSKAMNENPMEKAIKETIKYFGGINMKEATQMKLPNNVCQAEPEDKAEIAQEVVESLDCLQRMLWDLKDDLQKPEELGSLLGCIARRAELLK